LENQDQNLLPGGWMITSAPGISISLRHHLILGIWNENWSRKKIVKKTDRLDMPTCPPKFRQKNHRFRHLELIWNRFGHSKYLGIWVF
jgi:hypothetical protein